MRLDTTETQARVRGAHAYAKLSRAALAEAIAVSPSSLDKFEGTKPAREAPDWDVLARIAQACGLPFEFFTADFSRLWEIVPEGMPVLSRPRDGVRPAKSPPLPGTEGGAGSRREPEAS